MEKDLVRFKDLTFENFKSMAQDDSLSIYEKIGFPNSYRQGKEELIGSDIIRKLDIDIERQNTDKVLLDIGPGCSNLPRLIIDFCLSKRMTILLADCKEMLDLLPDGEQIRKFPGYYPDESKELFENFQGKVDYIICYSTLQVAYNRSCIFRFIDSALSLLRTGGRMLIGDIPNVSKRKRFFSTPNGIKYHQEFTGTKTLPDTDHHKLEPGQIDDGLIFGILQRYRNYGFNTYLLPQGKSLPMYNRREDIIIDKL